MDDMVPGHDDDQQEAHCRSDPTLPGNTLVVQQPVDWPEPNAAHEQSNVNDIIHYHHGGQDTALKF